MRGNVVSMGEEMESGVLCALTCMCVCVLGVGGRWLGHAHAETSD